MTDNDIHYLRSILGHLREFQSVIPDESAFSLGGEVLADNIDWLDCFIDRHIRAVTNKSALQRAIDSGHSDEM